MPAFSSARSSRPPAGPTKGWPLRSSRSPGCSPTSMTDASGEPSPNNGLGSFPPQLAGPATRGSFSQPRKGRAVRDQGGRSEVSTHGRHVPRRGGGQSGRQVWAGTVSGIPGPEGREIETVPAQTCLPDWAGTVSGIPGPEGREIEGGRQEELTV